VATFAARKRGIELAGKFIKRIEKRRREGEKKDCKIFCGNEK
jgi:hypothetical protein